LPSNNGRAVGAGVIAGEKVRVGVDGIGNGVVAGRVSVGVPLPEQAAIEMKIAIRIRYFRIVPGSFNFIVIPFGLVDTGPIHVAIMLGRAGYKRHSRQFALRRRSKNHPKRTMNKVPPPRTNT
jgi:hypothetical protein